MTVPAPWRVGLPGRDERSYVNGRTPIPTALRTHGAPAAAGRKPERKNESFASAFRFRGRLSYRKRDANRKGRQTQATCVTRRCCASSILKPQHFLFSPEKD